MFFTKRRIGAMLLLAFCIAYAMLAQRIPLLPFQADSAFHARTMPEILSILGIGLCLAMIVLPSPAEYVELKGKSWFTALAFLVLMSIYGLTIRPFGFVLASTMLLGVGYWLLGERKIWLLAVTSIPVAVAFWALMSIGLGVFIEPMPWFLRG
ncbi:tripartite tricarboxylate transporter TctB family protein [Maritalea mediterranea]|uniref:Tripartite tricarboxylate transporter TctB family protein n=1 Tax=Maritalea mediterranea TaxID=2909667 RepID=A0ABS9E5S5_9HYPH|nr:tripartite tricarboxylate transporter TctB family protein [Maritalea mediterranea]MCF4097259.1 tripartite tricarboxylate transporter TctB family protein [Maritalea mediterranea]